MIEHSCHLDNLTELSGYLLKLSEPEPQLRPLSPESVREARGWLEQAPERCA